MNDARGKPIGRKLAVTWIAALLALGLLLAPPELMRRGFAKVIPGLRSQDIRLARERLDSAMAWQRADSLRRLRGDSVVALAYTPPTRVASTRSAAEERVAR